MKHGSFGTLIIASLALACSSSPADGPSGSAGASSGSAGSSAGGSGGASTGGSPNAGSGGSSSGASGTAGASGGSGTSGGAGTAGTGGTSGPGADAGSDTLPVSDGGLSGSGGGSADARPAPSGDAGGEPIPTDGGLEYPLLKVLPLFSAPDVPTKGPMEYAPSKMNWTPPSTLPTRVGMGIAQHPMLYVGENYDRIIMVNGGKVVWTYDTAPSYELDDVWMLSNGNILYSHMTYIEEITPKKQVVWHYAPANGEIHTCQPIGLDKVLFVENALPMGRVRLYNLTTGTYETLHELAAGPSQHGEFRRFRMTGKGTYLASYMQLGKIVEYDKSWNPVWTFITPRPWSGVRLKNGNTMIQDESESTAKEVDSTGKVVWQISRAELKSPGGFGNTQSCERLSNGNTVVFGNGGTSVNNVQAIEVTPDKQTVWQLQDWIHLGDATSAQFLDEPGYPEVPGDTNH